MEADSPLGRQRARLEEMIDYLQGHVPVFPGLCEVVDAARAHFGDAPFTSKDVRAFLKQRRLNPYYEFTSSIYQQLGGHVARLPAPLALRMREKVARLPALLGVNHWCVLYNICELCGGDARQYVALLKDQAKLQRHDTKWRAICERIGWEFQPTCTL